MKKLFSMSNQLADRLTKTAKEQGTTQSRIVETALTIYIMLNYGSPEQAKKLGDMIPSNQVTLFEELDRLDKRKNKK